jgi:hypothetical protein
MARQPGAILSVPSRSPARRRRVRRARAAGLDLFGAGTDDLDALIVFENGIPGYQKSQQPYDWVPGFPGGQKDMVVFSIGGLAPGPEPDPRQHLRPPDRGR